MRTYFRPNRLQRRSEESIAAYEAAVLSQGHGAICVHDHTAGIDRRDRTIDNAARDELQKAGQARCRAAQEATLAADPLNAKDQPDGLMDT